MHMNAHENDPETSIHFQTSHKKNSGRHWNVFLPTAIPTIHLNSDIRNPPPRMFNNSKNVIYNKDFSVCNLLDNCHLEI